MDTRHLRHFLKIADYGSISRAAESLGIAQPSLSQQILRLEDELGFKLFRRTARGVTLTDPGRVLQEHARQILRVTEQAVEDVRYLASEPSGEVVLALPYSISKLATLEIVAAVRRDAPQVSFRLIEATTAEIRGWLDRATIDLGVIHDLGPRRNLSMRRLATEELHLIGPPQRFSPGQVIDLAELAEMPLILPSPSQGLRQIIEQEIVRCGGRMRIIQEIDAIGRIPTLVSNGLGYSILPMPAVVDELDAGAVSVASIGPSLLWRSLCIVRNAGRVISQASIRCEHLILQVLGQLIEGGRWRAEPATALQVRTMGSSSGRRAVSASPGARAKTE